MNKKVKYKLGNLEILLIIIGVLGCVLFGMATNNINKVEECVNVIFGCTWVALLATLGGPIVGAIVGFVGAQIVCYFSGSSEWLVILLGISVYGYWIGRYSEEIGVLSGKFNKRRALLFSMAQITASICYYSILYPLVGFVMTKADIYKLMNSGFIYTVCNILSSHILLIPLFALISGILKKK